MRTQYPGIESKQTTGMFSNNGFGVPEHSLPWIPVIPSFVHHLSCLPLSTWTLREKDWHNTLQSFQRGSVERIILYIIIVHIVKKLE